MSKKPKNKQIDFVSRTFISPQFLKFCIVGLMSTIVNYGFFYLLYRVHLHYLLASAGGYFLGVFVGYLMNRTWTFEMIDEKNTKEVSLYFLVYTISLFLGLAFLRFQVWIGIHVLLANLFTIGLTTVTNFVGTKFFVFKK